MEAYFCGREQEVERVGIYNRCSTEEESQMNALATQVFESREIAEKRGWKIAEQYVESQTGTVAYKRSEYQRLLEDMERDRFDIVMIKSIDRLTRSAKDWYFFLSRLTENRLRLYIYIEGKFYTPDDNLISGIKAILAEDFSRELSKKIKNAHRRRQEKKSGCNITCEMFGWNKVEKDRYEINEEEAEYYRTAFALAKEGKGFYTISRILYELGARGKKGQRISEVQWRKMLYTPRAHGTMILNTRTYNFDTKRYEEVPKEDWIVMEGALPPIVSKEYQEEVTAILQKKAVQRQVGGGNCHGGRDGKYELTRKLKCAECGRFYYRTCYTQGKGKKVVWNCATFLERGRKKGEGRQKEKARGCD
ncbi:MAG: recombinase family protein, partial [Lachnospiraceae bacterium]|nr:recombinase family protein [Lachnospiraceae bacterium]